MITKINKVDFNNDRSSLTSREQLKHDAKERVLDPVYNIIPVTIFYMLFASIIPTVFSLFVTDPINAIQQRFVDDMSVISEQMSKLGADASQIDVGYGNIMNNLLNDILNYGSSLLSKPANQILLFAVIVYFLFRVVLSFNYSAFALRSSRDEELSYGNLFDMFWLSGRIILVTVISSFLIGFGLVFFIIPAIYFYYAFSMANFVLADNPQMRALSVLRISRVMMRGVKLRLFVLDLSFIGWYLMAYVASEFVYTVASLFISNNIVLNILVLVVEVILGAFINPYIEIAHARFYDELKPTITVKQIDLDNLDDLDDFGF